jgi:hypothetical protein
MIGKKSIDLCSASSNECIGGLLCVAMMVFFMPFVFKLGYQLMLSILCAQLLQMMKMETKLLPGNYAKKQSVFLF